MNPSVIDISESTVDQSLGPLRLAQFQRYGLAVVSVGVALGTALLVQHFHYRDAAVPLLLFAGALSAWYGGTGPAVLAVILSTISFYWYFVEPVRTIYIYPSEVPNFIIFVAFASLMMWFSTIQRRGRRSALRRLNRELRAISNCNQTLLRATDEQSLLEEICRIVCEEAGYRLAWVAYAEHDEAKSVRPVAWTGTEEGYLTNLGITWADTERGRGPTGTAIRSGKTCCIQDFATDPRLAPWRESVLPRGLRSGVGLPLKDEQANAFGSLTIYSAQPNAFTSEEIRLLEELAGDLAFGIVTLRSQAARKRAEEALRDSERKYQELVEHANSIILHWRRDGRIIYLNEFGQRFFGYTESEIRGRHVIGTIVPETDSSGRELRPLVEEICANPAAFEQNVNENMRRNGERVWIAWTNLLDPKGEVTEILSIGVDITSRKRTEEALRRSEAYLAEGQRLSHTGSWAWSPATRQSIYWSEEMFRIFGLNSQEGVPTAETFWQRIHPEDLDRTRELLLKAAAGNMEYEHDHRIVLPDGTVKHIHAIGHPVLDENGQVAEYVGTASRCHRAQAGRGRAREAAAARGGSRAHQPGEHDGGTGRLDRA